MGKVDVRVADFFCGCGGTSAGFRKIGMSISVGIDNAKDAGKTFRSNFPEAVFIEREVRELASQDLLACISRKRNYALVFSACVPCQPFSKQNQNRVRRITRGHDASLLDELHRFVEFFRPEYIFLENVPGLQRISERTGPFSRFVRFLKSLDYSVERGLVASQDFGVPQRRQRLVLLGSRLGPIKLPEPTHGIGDGKAPYSTVWNWIGDLPAIAAGETHPSVPNHCARSLSEINLQRIRCTPEGGDRRDWPKRLLLDCHRNYNGHSDVYGRLSRNKPASALTTRCVTLSNGRFGHPVQDRALSIREAACLQTFSRDFVFFGGSIASMAQQVGNAVPILLASEFGQAIVRHYRLYRQGGGK